MHVLPGGTSGTKAFTGLALFVGWVSAFHDTSPMSSVWQHFVSTPLLEPQPLHPSGGHRCSWQGDRECYGRWEMFLVVPLLELLHWCYQGFMAWGGKERNRISIYGQADFARAAGCLQIRCCTVAWSDSSCRPRDARQSFILWNHFGEHVHFLYV
jgi:hypothetical protein